MCKKINDAGITSEYRFLRRSKIINYGLLLIAIAILMTILTIALQIQVIDLLKIEQTETGSFQAIMNEAAANLILKLPITYLGAEPSIAYSASARSTRFTRRAGEVFSLSSFKLFYSKSLS